jgi:ferrochelatase
MRLENVVALTRGILVNSPFVSQFSNIVYDAKSVKRGDLFIAFDEHTIEEAIFNGAYGVIFDKPTQITDSEIAWIKVPHLEDALVRLLRFKLLEKDVVAYEVNELILGFALQITTPNNLLVLNGDIKEIFKSLIDVEEKSLILFTPSITPIDIFTQVQTLPESQEQTLIKVVEQHTLFETSFLLDTIFYERVALPAFHISYLEQLLQFFNSNNIKYIIKKFERVANHFEPLFINNNFEQKEFGSTQKVVIVEQDCSFAQESISFLEKNSSWAKRVYLLPSSLRVEHKDAHIVYYENKKEIVELLKKSPFHFALVVGVQNSLLEDGVQPKKQISLFDF